MKETEIQKSIMDYLKLRNIKVCRNQSGFIRIGDRFINLGEEGWPDIIGCLPGGRFLGIEVKREGEKLTTGQKERIDELLKLGGYVFVAHNVEDVEQALTEYHDNE